MNRRPPKKRKSRRRATPAQAKAGISNLRAFNAGRSGMPNLRSGISVVIRSRGAELPPVPGAAEVAEQADAIILQMVSDLGYDRPEDVPAAKRAILESQRLNLLVLGLANRFLREEGILNPRSGKPHAILSVCVSFANSLRHNALALGLERKPRRVGPATLAEYLETRGTEEVKPGSVATELVPGSEPSMVPK
jgi:hypothetical protein